MSLHLVFSVQGWHACNQRMVDGDAVVLLGDGVYAAAQHEIGNAQVLDEDIVVRGVSLPRDTSRIDYPELVNLTTQHTPIVSWRD